MLFNLKENQFSIEILILKINSIVSLSNLNVSSEVSPSFTSILGFEFVHFNPQLFNKLLISLI
jgi:hypothetical protein